MKCPDEVGGLEDADNPSCSFCGRHYTYMEILIVASSGVSICSDCVVLAVDMIEDRRAERKKEEYEKLNKKE